LLSKENMSDINGAAAPTPDTPAPSAPAADEQANPVAVVQDVNAAPDAEATASEAVQPTTEGEEADGKPRRLSYNERQKRKVARLSTMLAEQAAELESLRQSKAATNADPEPKEADYNGDWTKYQADYAAWKATQNIRGVLDERDQRSRQQHIQERVREATEDFLERAEATKKLIPDYDQVISAFDASGGKFAPHVIEEVRDSDKGPELAYHIAKTPGLSAELNAMSPRDAAREIGRLEARLALPQSRKQTQAPAPLSALKGGAAPSFDPTKSDDMNAYVEWRSKGGGGPPLRR
jgi:hypothetical protein